jgi:hypothetical protein
MSSTMRSSGYGLGASSPLITTPQYQRLSESEVQNQLLCNFPRIAVPSSAGAIKPAGSIVVVVVCIPSRGLACGHQSISCRYASCGGYHLGGRWCRACSRWCGQRLQVVAQCAQSELRKAAVAGARVNDGWAAQTCAAGASIKWPRFGLRVNE